MENNKKIKSVTMTDIDNMERLYDKLFAIGNYCLIDFDTGFYRCNNKQVRGVFQDGVVRTIKNKKLKEDIKYVEFPKKERTGTELLDLYFEICNDSTSIAFAHNNEKVMYLYASDENIEEVRDLMKRY